MGRKPEAVQQRWRRTCGGEQAGGEEVHYELETRGQFGLIAQDQKLCRIGFQNGPGSLENGWIARDEAHEFSRGGMFRMTGKGRSQVVAAMICVQFRKMGGRFWRYC